MWVSPSRTLAEAALLHLFPVILNVNNRLRVVPQLKRAKIATSERRSGDGRHLPSGWRVSVSRARVFPRSIACSTRSDSRALAKIDEGKMGRKRSPLFIIFLPSFSFCARRVQFNSLSTKWTSETGNLVHCPWGKWGTARSVHKRQPRWRFKWHFNTILARGGRMRNWDRRNMTLLFFLDWWKLDQPNRKIGH